MSGRAPVTNPARRLTQIAARQAQLEIFGTSGAGRVTFSPSEPAGVTRPGDGGGDITTALTELDFTNDENALTAA